MAGICNSKDLVVESVAVFTAIGGGILALDRDNMQHAGIISPNEVALDTRVHAKQIMFIASLTNFISAIFMAPLYAAVALQKTYACRADSFLMILNRGLGFADVEIVQGTASQNEAENDLVGMCMSQYGTA